MNLKEIGKGKEGVAYLSNDGVVIKKILNSHNNYNIDKIITTKDIDLKSFAFPINLFAVDDQLMGYTSKYIKPITKENVRTIDFNNFMTSYYEVKDDVKTLIANNIVMNDLLKNVIYNGKQFAIIDTCSFERRYIITHDDLSYLDLAIRDLLDDLFETDEFRSISNVEEAVKKAKLKIRKL